MQQQLARGSAAYRSATKAQFSAQPGVCRLAVRHDENFAPRLVWLTVEAIAERLAVTLRVERLPIRCDEAKRTSITSQRDSQPFGIDRKALIYEVREVSISILAERLDDVAGKSVLDDEEKRAQRLARLLLGGRCGSRGQCRYGEEEYSRDPRIKRARLARKGPFPAKSTT